MCREEARRAVRSGGKRSGGVRRPFEEGRSRTGGMIRVAAEAVPKAWSKGEESNSMPLLYIFLPFCAAIFLASSSVAAVATSRSPASFEPLGSGTNSDKQTKMIEVIAFLGHVGSKTSPASFEPLDRLRHHRRQADQEEMSEQDATYYKVTYEDGDGDWMLV
ncbi:hypothetical protein Cni_G26717 [Canna indica]|uniref:Uncharacterized protein n=1 Tax=Canna indica TaxID=4628 RepID=A0AAQ3QNM2_9LILI|nr:hypothetical protein Cni_G26717 [Canna indica]